MNPTQNRLLEGYVAPDDATPETPAWRIVPTGKSANLAGGDRIRRCCHSRYTATDPAFRCCVAAGIAKQNLAATSTRLSRIEICAKEKN